jgi:hypothetical protein
MPTSHIIRGTMSNIDNLKAAYLIEVNKITNPLLLAQATVLLDEYIALKTAVSSLNAQTLDSYSIAQRSIQRRKIENAEAACRSKEFELNRALYGVSAIADMSQSEFQGVSV